MKEITKVVVPVPVFGTRFSPTIKMIPKECLPIIDKRLIKYADEEALVAGIDTLIFVTVWN